MMQKEDKPLDYWIVLDDYSVSTVRQLLESEKYADVAHLGRLVKTSYKHRRNAQTAARKQCEQDVENVRSQLLALKKILKSERPWEQNDNLLSVYSSSEIQ